MQTLMVMFLHSLRFRVETLYLGELGPKNQHCLSKMLISMAMFTFSIFRWKIPFLGKFSIYSKKIFRVKFLNVANTNMKNLMMLIIVLYWIRETLLGKIDPKLSKF